MPSSGYAFKRGYRLWISPLVALVLSLGLAFLSPRGKTGVCSALERSVFYPFRFAVGWGPRSLTAEHAAARLFREQGERRWRIDESLQAQFENARLRRLLGLGRRSRFEALPALVVGRGRGQFGELLVVEPGNPDGVVPGQAAVTPDGLVGRVLAREGRFARVQCLQNLDVAVSVLNQRSREGGILKWSPRESSLVIDGIPGQADWQVGDRLVTSGLGLDFPRGILVGWIEEQKPQRGGLLKTVLVRPAAVTRRVEEVLLLRAGGAGAEEGAPAEPDMAAVGSLYPVDAAARTARGLGWGGIGAGPGPEPVP
jgi:rod shape-determining protein MreC